MNRKDNVKIHSGISSLLMLFVVLSLTSFGLLSYSAAAADLKLTEKSLVHTENYYAAEKLAVEMIAEIDGALKNEETMQDLQDNSSVEITAAEDGNFSFQVAVDETQALLVVFHPEEGSGCSLVKKQLVALTEFQEDTEIEVWQG